MNSCHLKQVEIWLKVGTLDLSFSFQFWDVAKMVIDHPQEYLANNWL
jgi:hypothetical protein